MGEDITETLKVEKSCIRYAKSSSRPSPGQAVPEPGKDHPFQTIARGRAGASLLSVMVYAKFGEHQPLNGRSESVAKEGIDLDVSTLADWVGPARRAWRRSPK
jgi:transposase